MEAYDIWEAGALNEERGEKSRNISKGTTFERTRRLRARSIESGSFGDILILDQSSGVDRQTSRHCLQTSISVLRRAGGSEEGEEEDEGEGRVAAMKMVERSSEDSRRIGDVSATASDRRAVRRRRWSRSVESVDSIRSSWARRKGTSKEDGGRDWDRMDNAA